jgi:hypothetical protein
MIERTIDPFQRFRLRAGWDDHYSWLGKSVLDQTELGPMIIRGAFTSANFRVLSQSTK